MSDVDRSSLLDICDEAVGATCIRGHTWPWLRDEAGDPFAVDGWWPDRGLALLLYDGSVGAEPQAIAGTIAAHGLVSRAFDLQTFSVLGDPTPGRRAAFVHMFQMLLTDVGRTAPPADEPGTTVGFLWGSAEDFGDEEEDGDYFEDEDAEWAAEADAALNDWIAAPRPDLGWRARPVLLALLEAGTLTRRSTGFDLAPFEPLEIHTLAALALIALEPDPAETGATRDGIAALLAAGDRELQYALESLAGRGLAEAGPDDRVLGGGAVPWAITQLGNAAVEAWVSRCLSMFGGWPPDHPEVDDATG